MLCNSNEVCVLSSLLGTQSDNSLIVVNLSFQQLSVVCGGGEVGESFR